MSNRIAPIILFILVLTGSCSSAQAQNDPGAPSTDSVQINSVINEFYQTLSFKQGDANRYDDLTRFFVPQGLLTSNVGKDPVFSTPGQYISIAKENFQKQQIAVWEEYETCSKTEVFGKIAHRFSTYKIRVIAHGNESYRTGINAFQFIKQNKTWLITSVAWDRESQDLKIPSKYTCK